MSMPNIIKKQLIATDIRIVWSWGAHKWTALSANTLAFRVNAHRLNGIVCVTLDEGQDLYNISFFNNKSFKSLLEKPSEKFEMVKGVFCDDLLYVIDEVIEKIECYRY